MNRGYYFSKRMGNAAEEAVKQFDGSIVEIGAYKGGTTKELMKAAKKYSRKVFVIDPWIPGTQDCKGFEYQTFRKNTKYETNKHILGVIKKRSQNEKVKRALKNIPLAFVLIDGSHTYEDCYSDIMACSHAGIIVVDNYGDIEDVMYAVLDVNELLERKLVLSDTNKEVYMI